MNAETATRLESLIDAALERWDYARAEALAEEYGKLADEQGYRFRASWLGAQVALRAGELHLAQTRLQRLVSLPDSLPPALFCRIWLVRAEVEARLGQVEEARRCLEHAGRFASERGKYLLLELRLLRVRLLLGDVDACGEELARCQELLREARDTVNLVGLLCEEGRAWDARGRLDRAWDCFSEAARSARGLNHDPLHADAKMQLARVEHLLGRSQAALDAYDESVAQAMFPVQQQEARLRRILVLLEIKQGAIAKTELESLEAEWGKGLPSEELLPLVRMVRTLVLVREEGQEEAEAYKHARRGELTQAREMYQRALEERRGPIRRAKTALALGLLALGQGNGDDARRWLTQAECLARNLSLPETLWRALRARGRLLAEIVGDDEQARQVLEEAVLVSEMQDRMLRDRLDKAVLGVQRGDVVRTLLRAACRRGDPGAVFRFQELERGRFQLDLWQSRRGQQGRKRRLSEDRRLAEIEGRLENVEREIASANDMVAQLLAQRRAEILIERDRLIDEYLRDRRRTGDVAIPRVPELAEFQGALRTGTVYVSATVAEEDVHFLVVPAQGAARVVAARGARRDILDPIAALRACVERQIRRTRLGEFSRATDRAEVDECLEILGRGRLGETLAGAIEATGSTLGRVTWVPDEVLHGIPVQALRRDGSYLIERGEFVGSSSGSLVLQQNGTRARRSWWRRGLIVTESSSEQPAAGSEGEGVAATFSLCRILQGGEATREKLRRWMARASVVHLTCPTHCEVENPLASSIRLPSGESWKAMEFLDESLEGLPLVTLRGSQSEGTISRMAMGESGLVTGLLGAGVRGVVTGMWPVADRATVTLMWRFYREAMVNEVPTALARAQREALRETGANPLIWGAFVFFGDPQCLLPPGRWTRWWIRRRQDRHARCYPACGETASSSE